MKSQRVVRFRKALVAIVMGSILGITTHAVAATADTGWQLGGTFFSTPCYFSRAQAVTYPFTAIDFNGGLADRQNSSGCYMSNTPEYMAGVNEDAWLYGYDGSYRVCASFSTSWSGDTVFVGQRYYPTGSCSSINLWGTQSSAYYGLADTYFNAWSGLTNW